MDNDRFLTRVFDRQEKKMIYQGDKINLNGEDMVFQAVNQNGIIVACYGDNILDILAKLYSFANRFVPMQCSGRKDQNKKLIYTKDIVKICDGTDCSYHEIVRDLDYPAFDIFPLLYDDCNSLQAALTELFVEVVGNKFEQPELMEVKA